MFKKISCIILGVIFTILGIIGLILPVVPQIPLLAAALFCFCEASDKLKSKVKNSRIYRKYIKENAPITPKKKGC